MTKTCDSFNANTKQFKQFEANETNISVKRKWNILNMKTMQKQLKGMFAHGLTCC